MAGRGGRGTLRRRTDRTAETCLTTTSPSMRRPMMMSRSLILTEHNRRPELKTDKRTGRFFAFFRRLLQRLSEKDQVLVLSPCRGYILRTCFSAPEAGNRMDTSCCGVFSGHRLGLQRDVSRVPRTGDAPFDALRPPCDFMTTSGMGSRRSCLPFRRTSPESGLTTCGLHSLRAP